MYWFSKRYTKIGMIAPTMLLYLTYVIIPVLIAFYYSFTNFTGIGKPQFVGLQNFWTLFHDKIFYIALKNTVIVLTMTVLMVVPGSFFLALLLDRNFKANKLAKALNFSPNIISPILVGLIWVFILDPKMGLINAALRGMGFDYFQPEWIGGQVLTPYAVAFVFTWQTIGYNATIFLAGLKMVPHELYEASEIDGADKVQRLVYITLPMIKQTFVIIMLLVITGCFKIFETVYQLTNGGPNHVSDLLVTYMYFSTFNSSRFGYGMSIAVVTFLLTAIFAVIYIKVTKEQIGRES
ncbi:carbohydrate ABC transporter permease [Kineothrix sp. MB12-C1]|uniref:carbohydrate ABC transporter permease n=1 Tax=Kineothrix sp. MB12-C1 TaxID=3070215 RepID=UPI0027D30D07|nr:sugar ABC transporter permease [Kineothrix sp. MB12-C1]WMC93341.1 sugar ABC transporter permease [Kineothrix sp. MB12-C1]